METKAARLAKIAEIAHKVQVAGAAYERLSPTEKARAQNRVNLQVPQPMDYDTVRRADIDLNKPYGV
jgi:ribosomal protein S7